MVDPYGRGYRFVCIVLLSVAASVAITATLTLVTGRGLKPEYTAGLLAVAISQAVVVVLMTLIIRRINKKRQQEREKAKKYRDRK